MPKLPKDKDRSMEIEISYDDETILSEGFATIAAKVLKDPDISLQAKGLYAYLSAFVNRGTGDAWPSISLILSQLTISEPTFYKYRNELVEAGYLYVTERKRWRAGENGDRKPGTWKNNRYVLPTTWEKILRLRQEASQRKQEQVAKREVAAAQQELAATIVGEETPYPKSFSVDVHTKNSPGWTPLGTNSIKTLNSVVVDVPPTPVSGGDMSPQSQTAEEIGAIYAQEMAELPAYSGVILDDLAQVAAYLDAGGTKGSLHLAITKAARSDFLSGRTNKATRTSLTWIVRNIDKILSGRYDTIIRPPKPKKQPSPRSLDRQKQRELEEQRARERKQRYEGIEE